MASFGQGIRPELGRTDYTPFLQGAAQGAQMSGNSAQRGWESIGAGISQGLESYDKMKKENKAIETEVNTSAKWMRAMADDPNITPQHKKMLQESLLFIGDVTKPLRERQAQAKGAAGYLTSSIDLAEKARKSDLENRLASYDKIRADAALLTAQREKPALQGTIMTPEQVKAIPAGTDFKGVPMEDGNIYVTGLSRFAPGAVTNVNMGGNEYDKTLGKTAAEQHFAEYSAAKEAPANIAKLDEVSGILKSGDVTTGIGAEIFQNVNRLRAQFLNDQKAGKNVSNTQLLDSLLGSDVFPMISALNIGARGMDTPAEREFLRQSFTGTKEMTPEALSRLTEIRRNIQLRAIERFEKSNEAGAYKKFFEVTGNPQLDFSDVPPSDATSAQWAVMSPEQRSLWKKPKK